MSRRSAFPAVHVVAALALAAIVSLAGQPGPARAATPGLTLVSDARYDVRPDERRVDVSVAIKATNHRKNTAIRRYYYDRAFLAVMPGTTNFRVTASGSRPTVRVAARKPSHTLLRIDFGRRLPAGGSMNLRLQFELADAGGPPDRPVRIGPALTTFPVWAFASESTPGGTVTVSLPDGFEVRSQGAELGEPERDGGTVVLRSGRLAKPLAFVATIVAQRPGSFVERSSRARLVDGELELVIRSWPEDSAWADRVGGVFERGLPELSRQIGLPYAGSRSLVVEEAAVAAGEHAGRFDPDTGRVEIAYHADEFDALHAAGHAWFNGRLVADRWLTEAFASYYAVTAATALDIAVNPETLTEELDAARIPLNAWTAGPAEDQATEQAAYAAALALATEVAQRAGEDGLQRVWGAAGRRESGYDRGPLLASAPDWRTVLDLLERHTGTEYDDLWRHYVVRPSDAELLDQRRAAREDLEATRSLAGAWQLPPAVDAAMASWRFDRARELLAEVRSFLSLRGRVSRTASSLGLTPPPTLRATFEGVSGLAAARAQGESELAALDAIDRAAAAAAAPARQDLIAQIGLLGRPPERDLQAAREAYEAGEVTVAIERAAAVLAAVDRAPDTGAARSRGLLAAAFVAFAAILLVTSRLRGPRSRRAGRQEDAAPAG